MTSYIGVEMIDPRIIANSFLYLAKSENTTIDPMKLQKLIFLAHGACLARRDEPFSSEQPQAWPYGPVFPSVYFEFRHFRDKPILGWFTEWNEQDRKQVITLIDEQWANQLIVEVWRKYKYSSGVDLSKLTHEAGSPWYKAKSESSSIINDDWMRDYYRSNPI